MSRQVSQEIEALQTLNAQIKQRERELQQLKHQRLSSLPAMLDFASMDALILVLLNWASPKLRAKLAASLPATSRAPRTHAKPGPKPGSKQHFSDELKTQIRAELAAGTKTIAQIAKEYGPAKSSLAKWKQEWGLTNRQSKDSAPSTSGQPIAIRST